MPLVLANRVQETGTANTTVSFTLTGAVTGFQSFAVIGNTNTTYYSATDGAGNWEVGLGTYSTTGPTLTRTTVYASSNSGSAVTFSGAVNIFVTYPSGRSVNLNESGNVSALGTVSSGTWQGSTIGVAYGGTGVTTSSGPNSVVLRDANENITVNRISQGLQTITASGGVTTLTAASDFNQQLVGTGGHTFRLPDATTLTDTTTFQFNNNATGTLTIQNNAATTVGTVAPGGAAGIALMDNSTSGGTWDVHGYIPESVTWGTNALALGSTVITGGTWNGGTITPAYGGTGLTSYTTNGAVYATGTTTLTSGTLPVISGGTGRTAYTASAIVYADTTTSLASSANLAFNGTDLTVSGAVNAGSVNATTADLTNLEVTNIKAKDGTAAMTIADSTGNVSVSSQLTVDNLNLSANTISSTNANGSINIVPNGTGGVYADNTNGAALFVRNTTASASGSSIVTFQNNDGAGTFRSVARASGVTTSNGGNGDFLVETAYSGVLYKGLLVDSLSDVYFYNSSGAKDLRWDSVNQRLGVNNIAPTANLDVTGTANVSGALSAGSLAGSIATGSGASGTWAINISGNAATATTATTASNVNNGTLTMNVSGVGLSGSQTFTANQASAATFTVTSNATSANTASTIVARDASGNFSAGTITATLSGSATSAGSVSNSVTFNNGGAGGASGSTFNGSGALTVSYNTVGAPSTTGTNASGTWSISISGNAATATNATQLGGYASTTYVGKFGNTYYQADNWIQFNNSTGLYWPAYNAAELTANVTSSYGAISVLGVRGGWRGIHFNGGGNAPHLMFDGSANGGIYYETGGRWASYYSYSNNCWGIGTSTTNATYNVYADKGYYAGTRIDSPIFYDANNTAYYTDPAGTSNIVGLLTTDAVSNNQNGLRNVNPGGGSYVDIASTVSGAIRIKLPQNVYPMIRFTVRVYTYDGLSFDIYCGGHTSSSQWYNTFAYMGTQNRSFLNVRFSSGGGNMYVYIGDLGSTWSYPQVFITDVQVGYSNYEYDRWDNGWAITFDTASYNTVYATQAVYPSTSSANNNYAAYASIYYDAGNTAYYVDPASTSNLVGLTVANTITGSISGNAATITSQANSATITASTTATANQIVLRDSSGDDNRRYGFANYFNSSDDVSGGTITYIMAKFGDNYYRSATAAKVASFISGQTMNINGSSTSCSGNAATATSATTATNATNVAITNDTTTNATYYLAFMTATSGNAGVRVSNTKLTFNPSTGNFTAGGNVTAYSDERLKTNWRDLPDNLVEQLAQVKAGVYDRTDTDKPVTQVGVSAQSLQDVIPNAVVEDVDGMLSVAYGNAALVAAIKLAERVVELERRLAALESGEK